VRRKIGVLACTLAAAAVVGVPAAWGANSSVSIQNFSFQPQSVTINVGETVTWTMRDANTQHTVTADNSSFNSGNLSTGQSFAHTFGQAGSFSYHCSIHTYMTGTVNVVGGGGSPAPTSPPATAPAPSSSPQAAPAATPSATAAPHTTTAPPTTAAPTTTSSPTTTIAPPAAADAGTTSSTTAAAGGGVALPAAKNTSSGGGGLSAWLVALAVVLVLGAAGGGVLLRRRRPAT